MRRMHAQVARHDAKVPRGSGGEGGLDVEHDPHARLDEQWAFRRLSNLPQGAHSRSGVCHGALREMQASQVCLVRQVLAVP
jgi:hypothetical protein